MTTPSKFWDADDVSVSEASESESSTDSKNVSKTENKLNLTTNRWANLEDSSSDEEEKRVVRSAKEKQWNQIRLTIKSMNNYKNIDDFSQLNISLDNLIKSVRKLNSLSDKEDCPKFLIQTLAGFEDYVTEKSANKEELKKLSKTKSINFHTFKSKLRKYLDEFRHLIDEFRTNPNSFNNVFSEMSDSSASDTQSEDSSQFNSDSESSEASSLSRSHDESESKSSFESDAESLSESSNWSNESVQKKDAKISISADTGNERGMKVWGKKPESKSDVKSAIKEKKKPISKPKQKPFVTLETSLQHPKAKGVASIFAPDEKIDAKLISKKLQELNLMRKKKGFDYLEQIRYFQEIANASLSVSPQSYIEVLNYLIGAYFDANPGLFASLNSQQWNQIYNNINAAIETLSKYEDTYFPLLTVEDDIATAQASEADTTRSLNASHKGQMPDLTSQSNVNQESLKSNTALVLTNYVERLDNELYKALQLADLHSNEYRIRLNQVVDMLVILWKSYSYLKTINQLNFAKMISLQILHHMYYRNEKIGMCMWDMVKQKLEKQHYNILGEDNLTSKYIIKTLVREIIGDNTDMKSKILAILYYAYFLSLDGDFYQAKDLLQTSNIHDLAMQCNISTQILYNRNLVQLGLAAFSLGLTHEAYSYLTEICNMGKYKELLAQGLSNPKGLEKSSGQDRIEKQRLLPYHMHIASELVETVYNVCAMLIEVPYMVQNSIESNRKPLTRSFRRQLELYDRQVFNGPPETSRETVLVAAKALQTGDWKYCCEVLNSLKIWSSFKNPESVRQTIMMKVQEEALRTYIFRYVVFYDAFDVDQLASVFKLPLDITHSIISKLLIQKKLDGSWDGAAKCVLLKRVDRSIIQTYALQLAEKINTSLDQNEFLLADKNSKFLLTQNFQKDDRFKKLDEKWTDRRVNFYNKNDWNDNRPRWDNGNPLDGRRIKFTRFAVTTFEKNEQRRSKR